MTPLHSDDSRELSPTELTGEKRALDLRLMREVEERARGEDEAMSCMAHVLSTVQMQERQMAQSVRVSDTSLVHNIRRSSVSG